MAIPDSTKVTLRGDVQRPLTYAEMDENFDQLKETIDQSNQQQQDVAGLQQDVADFNQSISNNKNSVFEALRRSYAEAGLNLVAGSFEEGGILTSASDVLLHKASGIAYSWSGVFPKVVAASSTPATSGGVGAGAWVDRTQDTIRSELNNKLKSESDDIGSDDLSYYKKAAQTNTYGGGYVGFKDAAEYNPAKAGTNIITNDVLNNKILQFDAVGNAFRYAKIVLALADFGVIPNQDVTLLVKKLVKYLKNKGIQGGCILFPPFPVKMQDTIEINAMHNVMLLGAGVSGSYGSFGNSYNSSIDWVGAANINAFYFTGYGTNNWVSMLQINGGCQTALYFENCIQFKATLNTLRENDYGILAKGGGVGYVANNSIRSNNILGIGLRKGSGDTDVIFNDVGGNLTNIQIATGDCRVAFNNIFSSVNNINANAGNYGGVGIEWRGDLGSDSDTVIYGGECHSNLIAANGTQVKLVGATITERNVVGVNVHNNWVHQADNGGAGFDSANPYGRGILLQFTEDCKVKDQTRISGCRDYAVKSIGSFDGGTEISGNVCKDTQGDDIILDVTQWATVSKNKCRGGTGRAIYATNELNTGDWSQNNLIVNNTFKDKPSNVYVESGARANMVIDNLGGTVTQYVFGLSSPLSCLRHLNQAGNQESHRNLPVVNI